MGAALAAPFYAFKVGAVVEFINKSSF